MHMTFEEVLFYLLVVFPRLGEIYVLGGVLEELQSYKRYTLA